VSEVESDSTARDEADGKISGVRPGDPIIAAALWRQHRGTLNEATRSRPLQQSGDVTVKMPLRISPFERAITDLR
jgi:hypothetical protein